jgi:hypothetical protein
MLSASSPIAATKMSLLCAAAEMPMKTGFAEQPGCSQSGMTSFAPTSSDEVSESGDEVSEALSTSPSNAHVSLIKSLSDVIVFGTNWANEMGKDCRLHRK